MPIVARVGPAAFAEFSVDLALPRDDVPAVETLHARATLTGSSEVDEIPAITVLALPAQIADKICAVFERRGERGTPSSRARDLADLAMIAAQVPVDGDEVSRHLRREEARRLAAGTLLAPLPESFRLADEQLVEWSRRWKKATRQAPIGFDEAYASAAAFVDPVLAGDVLDAAWSPSAGAWVPADR